MSAAHEKRRDAVLRYKKMISELTKKLQEVKETYCSFKSYGFIYRLILVINRFSLFFVQNKNMAWF